jgi:hypothetical protein
LVELLVVDAMRSLNLAVQMWHPRPNVHVPDVAFFETSGRCRRRCGGLARRAPQSTQGCSSRGDRSA